MHIHLRLVLIIVYPINKNGVYSSGGTFEIVVYFEILNVDFLLNSVSLLDVSPLFSAYP